MSTPALAASSGAQILLDLRKSLGSVGGGLLTTRILTLGLA
jgi:hypothetical protein